MTRRRSPNEYYREAKAQRDFALARLELRDPPTPRVSAAGATSPPIKVADADVERMVAEFEAKKNLKLGG